MTLSIVLFVASLYFYKKQSNLCLRTIYFLIIFSAVILYVLYGAAYYFTGEGINEAALYHLNYGLSGAGYLEYSLLIFSMLIALLASVIFLVWAIYKRGMVESNRFRNNILSFVFLSISFSLNPALVDLYHLKTEQLVISKQAEYPDVSDFYQYYRTPQITQSSSEPKNIVFVYAEGLERTYFDENIFPGLMYELRELESRSINFTNIKQVPGTGWTVGGITASQCGIPLFTPSHGNSMSGMDQFLSSAVCLGDLLKDNGYLLTYMGGASSKFAGKGKLFKSHGFADVFGRDELLPKLDDQTYKTAWGLYDDSLFNILYDRFNELSKSNKKFGLFTLTLDTHGSSGDASKSCEGIKYQDGANAMLNSVACSDFLIAKLIKKIIDSPYAEKTIVVLVSDHLSMRTTAYRYLKDQQRRNLFMVFDSEGKNSKLITTEGSTLDIASTLLPFIGYIGEIGLGRNLLDNSLSQSETTFIHTNLERWRDAIYKFWDYPSINDGLAIDISTKIASIDQREFGIPILIELTDTFETTLQFQFDTFELTEKLIHVRNALNNNNYFILIDECKNAKILDKTLGTQGLCLLAGQGSKYTKIEKLENNVTFSVNEIRKLLNLSNVVITK